MSANGRFSAYFDGACRGNPGSCGLGGVILDPDGKPIFEISRPAGHGTNNEAEYKALIAVAEALGKLAVQSVDIFGDSELVVNQVNGDWAIRKWHLQPLCESA